MGTRYPRARARRDQLGRAVALIVLLGASVVFVQSVAFGAGVNCNGVFPGKTPHVIGKSADKSQAYAGQTVVFTVTFHSTGVSTADVRDCYRVDNGSDKTLNALVTGLNALVIHTNSGPKGTAQTVTFMITVPSDPSLIGHALVDRAKITKGSVESKSELVSVDIVAPPGLNPTPSPTVVIPSPTVSGITFPAPKPKVKGGQLAHTGSASTPLAALGTMLLMLGLLFRRQIAVVISEISDTEGSAYLARYDEFLRSAARHFRSKS